MKARTAPESSRERLMTGRQPRRTRFFFKASNCWSTSVSERFNTCAICAVFRLPPSSKSFSTGFIRGGIVSKTADKSTLILKSGPLEISSNHRRRHRINWRQILRYYRPRVTFVVRAEKFSRVCPEIDSRRIARVHGHAFAIDSDICILLRQSFRERLPGFAAVAAAEDAQLVAGRTAEFRAFERDHV